MFDGIVRYCTVVGLYILFFSIGRVRGVLYVSDRSSGHASSRLTPLRVNAVAPQVWLFLLYGCTLFVTMHHPLLPTSPTSSVTSASFSDLVHFINSKNFLGWSILH